jgi:hypothetical protein
MKKINENEKCLTGLAPPKIRDYLFSPAIDPSGTESGLWLFQVKCGSTEQLMKKTIDVYCGSITIPAHLLL